MELDPKTRVLVVDDMSTSRQILVMLLEKTGITDVRTARDARLALADMRSHPPDIVIADLNMPGMNGYDFLRQVRADPKMQHVPFVLTSGDEGNPLIRRARDKGADQFLAKPFRAADLHAAIAMCQARREAGGMQELRA